MMRYDARCRMPALGLLSLIGLLVAACGNDPTSPVGRDLSALCAGRRTDLAVRMVVTSVTNVDVAVGDTLTGTFHFVPESPVGGSVGPCAVAGSVRLTTAATSLARVRDSIVPTFQSTGSAEHRAIGIAGTGDGNVFMVVLPVRDSVGGWDYFMPSREAGVSGTIHYAAAPAR